MTINQLMVPFYAERVLLIDVDGEPFVPVRPLAERFGLAWQPQHRKLEGQKRRWGVTIMVIPSAGGAQETTCIPLRKLPAWLYSIHPNKVLTQSRAALEFYQAECDDVLWQHWSGQHKGELATLRSQVTRLRAFCLAFNPVWAKIAALQKAGVASNMVRFAVRRPVLDVADAMQAMERNGILTEDDWSDAPDPDEPDAQGQLFGTEVQHG